MVIEVDGGNGREQTKGGGEQRFGNGVLTTARSVEPCGPMFMKAVMIPHTVPNSPMKGVMLAVVARNVTRFSNLFTSMDEARSSARSTAVILLRLDAAQGFRDWPGAVACRSWAVSSA